MAKIKPQANPDANWLVPVSEFRSWKKENICFRSKVIASPDI